jgi:hypothetical protein
MLEREHPAYSLRSESWRVLLDAFEGAGGFLDGSYLWEYPREDVSDYNRRKESARYHNHLESLVDIYVRFIFTNGVARTSNSEEFNEWTHDVDGQNTSLETLLKRLLTLALVHGHAGALVDKTEDAPVDQTRAGERARVVASVFSALAIPDWRHARSTISAVKLLEAPPQVAITEEPDAEAAQYLLWTLDGWARFDHEGNFLRGEMVPLGLVPLVIFQPKPSYTSLMLGRPLIPNANVVRACYNRASEEDDVIRGQAFSVLAVSVPPDGNVEQTKIDLGASIGISKALVVRGEIDYKTPDQSVPGTIRENIAYLTREMYRAAHVRIKGDGLQAESGESIRLQYTELNEALQGIAKGLAAAEQQIARAWFAWMSATPEQAQSAYEAAEVEAVYPSEFFTDSLLADLEAWAEAVRMDLGPTMTRRIKRKAVRRIDPDIPAAELETIDAEIEAQDGQPEPVPVVLDRGDPEGQAMREAMEVDA